MRVRFIAFANTVLCTIATLSATSLFPVKAVELRLDSAGLDEKSQLNASNASRESLAPNQKADALLPLPGLRVAPSTSQAIDLLIAADPLARPIPSLPEIQQIQEDLRNLDASTPAQRRSAYPGVTISNPTGYGADRGRVFLGIGFQSRTRYSGGRNVGTAFGGGRGDGTAGIGFGVGDARESVGLQVSYTAASFGGSRDFLSGGLNAKIHRRLGDSSSVAIGGEGIINFGRLPEDDDGIEFNDFENTYYGAVTHVINLKEDFSEPFSRLVVTGGAGTGRFRSVDQLVNDDFAVGLFGSAALQVYPWANFITEWTGQDLAAGLSIVPFSNVPIVITPAFRDIIGEGDGDPRFVVGIGFSLSNLFSSAER